jgi:hypothetical protein
LERIAGYLLTALALLALQAVSASGTASASAIQVATNNYILKFRAGTNADDHPVIMPIIVIRHHGKSGEQCITI